jgi:hypothetical protein
VTAFTGSAAQNAGGVNIHALLRWRPGHEPIASSSFLKSKFAGVKLIIIDEISALSQALLGKVSLCLQAVFSSDTVFGGLNALLVGDWLQLPPTGANTLFSAPKPEKSSNATYSARCAGFSIWQAINYVIISHRP